MSDERIGPHERFEGERVVLRLLTEADVCPRYVAWLQDPDVNRYLETRWEEQTLDRVRDFVLRTSSDPSSFLFAILDRADGTHVGNIKIGPCQRHHSRADVSYFIGERDRWGHGLATDAIRTAVRIAFERLDLHRVQAGLYASNTRSRRALERLGFQLEATLREELKGASGWEDHLLFGLLRTEWKGMTSGNMQEDMLKPIDLGDLPRWSPWPARIAGTSPWRKPERTLAKVDLEYDKDKYASMLEYQRQSGADVKTVRDREFGIGVDHQPEICISVGDRLFLSSVEPACERFQQLLLDVLGPLVTAETTLIELGCGYGYNLWRLSRRLSARAFVGGEYSPNAVALAEQLYSRSGSIRVHPFNFYDGSYPLLDRLEGPCVVFTSHAIEQLPSAKNVIDVLLRDRKIADVVHFEPVLDYAGDHLLGLLRRRYIELNDYNVDLVPLLERHRDAVEIVESRHNCMGTNPVCATSVVHWKPSRHS